MPDTMQVGQASSLSVGAQAVRSLWRTGKAPVTTTRCPSPPDLYPGDMGNLLFGALDPG